MKNTKEVRSVKTGVKHSPISQDRVIVYFNDNGFELTENQANQLIRRLHDRLKLLEGGK